MKESKMQKLVAVSREYLTNNVSRLNVFKDEDGNDYYPPSKATCETSKTPCQKPK